MRAARRRQLEWEEEEEGLVPAAGAAARAEEEDEDHDEEEEGGYVSLCVRKGMQCVDRSLIRTATAHRAGGKEGAEDRPLTKKELRKQEKKALKAEQRRVRVYVCGCLWWCEREIGEDGI